MLKSNMVAINYINPIGCSESYKHRSKYFSTPIEHSVMVPTSTSSNSDFTLLIGYTFMAGFVVSTIGPKQTWNDGCTFTLHCFTTPKGQINCCHKITTENTKETSW